MGIIALGLVADWEYLFIRLIPSWVLVMWRGNSSPPWDHHLVTGGKFGTLAGNIYRIRPLNALASQAASSILIVAASIFGMPVSTPHLISTALMGAGAAERINKVRWHVATEMAAAWALTIPATIVISALIYKATMSL